MHFTDQSFALYSAVIKAQKCLARIEASQCMQCVITEKQSNQINIPYHDETKKRAIASQTVRTKESLQLSHGRLSQRQASDNSPLMKVLGQHRQ